MLPVWPAFSVTNLNVIDRVTYYTIEGKTSPQIKYQIKLLCQYKNVHVEQYDKATLHFI